MTTITNLVNYQEKRLELREIAIKKYGSQGVKSQQRIVLDRNTIRKLKRNFKREIFH